MDNVIILGAGASFDAEIPLLGNFVETMRDIAQRSIFKGKNISKEDGELFKKIEIIRSNLDYFLSRTKFDNDNIEDLLSILSFNAMSGDETSRNSLSDTSRAIARTIELCCKVQYMEDKKPMTIHEDIYIRFWRSLFNIYKLTRKFPNIITLNYDLVLERSLLNAASGYQTNEEPFSEFSVDYHKDNWSPFNFKMTYNKHTISVPEERLKRFISHPSASDSTVDPNAPKINILKLHGSINFSKEKPENIYEPTDNPHILPPIFNKFESNERYPYWQYAMDSLRKAKNITIVGYSLPKTDIYMQYFLKSAIGPNSNIRKINIFDPAAHEGHELHTRYISCFSDSMKKNIRFYTYSFTDFAYLISGNPQDVFFI